MERWRAARRCASCDLWGFTLPHELTYTNVLEMLDLAGVPLHAAERGEGDPIVLGGGPGVANPLPLAPFFDAFFVGEAEGRLAAIVAALGRPRARGAWRLASCPASAAARPRRCGRAARRRRPPRRAPGVHGLLAHAAGDRPLVPVLEAVHDRAVVEVMRGCTAGCRFCQAGMWYRPVRERPVDMVVDGRRARCCGRPAATRSRSSR